MSIFVKQLRQNAISDRNPCMGKRMLRKTWKHSEKCGSVEWIGKVRRVSCKKRDRGQMLNNFFFKHVKVLNLTLCNVHYWRTSLIASKSHLYVWHFTKSVKQLVNMLDTALISFYSKAAMGKLHSQMDKKNSSPPNVHQYYYPTA